MVELITKRPGAGNELGAEKRAHGVEETSVEKSAYGETAMLGGRRTPAGNGRLAASSILEVVITLVLIVLVLGLSMTIYANVMRSALPARTLRAELTLQQAMDRLEQTGADQSATSSEGWQVTQQVKAYEGAVETPAGTLSAADLTLTDEYHNELARLKKIILLKPPSHE